MSTPSPNLDTHAMRTQLKATCIELSKRLGCPIKHTLATVIEYDVSDYINSAYGYQVVCPEPGYRGADAVWTANGQSLSVEYKTTELVPLKKPRCGQIFQTPKFNIQDWPTQLSQRDVFVCAMHDKELNMKGVVIIPPPLIQQIYQHITSRVGTVALNPGTRYSTSISLKHILDIPSHEQLMLIYDGVVVAPTTFRRVFIHSK